MFIDFFFCCLLLNSWIAQVAANKGEIADATPFTSVTVKNVSEVVRDLGYHQRGNEVLYSGFFGRKINAQVFTKKKNFPLLHPPSGGGGGLGG